MACGDDLWVVSIQRSVDNGPFSAEQKTMLAGLSRCLSTTAAVSRALGFAAADAALDAFELSGSAVLLLNWRGEVIKANASAERLLKGDVRIVRKRLVAASPDATAALDRALHNLLWRPSGAALLPPVALPREGELPLLAYPLRLDKWSANPLVDAQALLVLVDPAQRRRPPVQDLQDVFRLTPAEARIAARLAAGEALDAISDELSVSRETSRHHLKNIFAKTGVRRQAELVALFAGMIGSARVAPD